MGDSNGPDARVTGLYRELAEKSLDIMLLFRVDGSIIHANPAAVLTYGYSLEELKTKNISDIWTPETHSQLADNFNNVRAGSFRTDTIHRRRDGGEFPVESTWTLAESGSETLILSVVRDISERKRSEKEYLEAVGRLKASEERYDRLVEQTIDCIFLASPDGRYTDVNRAGCEMFGMTRDELLAMRIPDILHPSEHHRILPTIEKLASGRPEHCGEWRYIRKDGSEFIGELLGKQMPDGTLQGILRDVTDRRAAEAALRESEERWKTTTEALPNLVWTDQPDGNCDWLSPQWEEYTGYPVARLLGLGWLETVIHPEDRERTQKSWNDACLGIADYDLEYRIRRFDGEYHWFKTRGTPIKDENGDIVYWFGTCTDIEDIKRAEAARAESEATLRAFYENSPVFMGITEVVGDDILHVYDNPATCRFFGAPNGATAGKLALKEIGADPDVVGIWIDNYREAERTQKPVRFDHPHTTPNGIRYLAVTVSLLGPGTVGPTRFCYVADDVTDTVTARETLLRSEERFRLLVQHSANIIWRTGPDGKYVGPQESFERYTGLSFDEYRHDGGLTSVHPDDVQTVIEAWTKGLSESQPIEIEYRLRSREGEYRHFLTRGIPMLDGDGRVHEWVGYAEDITDRKRAEEELRTARDVLEDTVSARTAELRKLALDLQAEVEVRKSAEARLRQLMTRLVNIQEEERRRIGRNIHDHLGQQLTGLRINLATLEAQTASMNGVADLARKIQGLAEELDSSIDFVTWELIPGNIGMVGLPKALQELVSTWSRRFNIPAEFNFRGRDDHQLPDEVSSNLYRITQEALHNIVKHAYASRTDVLFELNDDTINLIIEDDGKGFDPGHHSNEGVHSLGLVSMHERASAIEGSFEIESNPGKGTTIFVKLNRTAKAE